MNALSLRDQAQAQRERNEGKRCQHIGPVARLYRDGLSRDQGKQFAWLRREAGGPADGASQHDERDAEATGLDESQSNRRSVLPPMLADIRREHPALVFELALNNRRDDLLQRDADIAVRMTRQDGLVARKIGGLRLGFDAHRRYVEQCGVPKSVETLSHAHLIGFDRDDHSARAVAEGILPISRDLFAFRCDNDAAQMAAIGAGLGIGAIQEPLARRNPDLVPCSPARSP